MKTNLTLEIDTAGRIHLFPATPIEGLDTCIGQTMDGCACVGFVRAQLVLEAVAEALIFDGEDDE